MFEELAPIWVRLVGVWLFSDGVYSLIVWAGKGQSWWRDHSLRVVRMLVGLAMIFFG